VIVLTKHFVASPDSLLEFCVA